MATVKIGTLLIRTLAKPISARIKNQAREHERFRKELRTRVHELGERLRTREEAAAEERQQYEQLASILSRVVEIGLRGGAWAEGQDHSPLQLPHVQSDLLPLMSPSVTYRNTERTDPSSYSTDTVLSSNDTRDIS